MEASNKSLGHPQRRWDRMRPNLRGVVLQLYVYDSKEGSTLACAADVLVYSSVPNSPTGLLRNVLIPSRLGGGHQDGATTPLKAARYDLATNTPIQVDAKQGLPGGDPLNFDGSHVIVGHYDYTKPYIADVLPHPYLDLGTNADTPLGDRVRQLEADGRPLVHKFKGVSWGVDQGHVSLDTRGAYSAETSSTGQEVHEAGKGNISIQCADDAEVTVTVGTTTVTVSQNSVVAAVEGGPSLTLQGAGAAATLQVGNGAVQAVNSSLLSALWGSTMALLASHTHPVQGQLAGPSPQLVTLGTTPPTTYNADSTALSIPG